MKLNKKIKNIKGVSLFEIVLYLAIFTIISILVINSFIIIMSTFSTVKSNQNLASSASNSMERIAREIRQAKNIDIGNSTFDTDSSILRLNDTDGTSYVVFDKNGDDLRISKNGTIIGNLLVDNISINKLVFKRISTLNSEGVKIEMELEDTHSKTTKIIKFYDTVILRGGY